MKYLIIAITLILVSCKTEKVNPPEVKIEYRELTERESEIAEDWIGFIQERRRMTSDLKERRYLDSFELALDKHISTKTVDIETGAYLAKTAYKLDNIAHGIYD